jgi:chemosensory pili system protein ChpB (putative protein-glutamate methylesterase)
MAAEPLRVALLARPGVARERLRGVLDESGAQRVLEADPTELSLPALLEAAPQAVLVALDSVTEDVLDRFDRVLFDPAVDVIYEEADLAASREGWDVARWQRHLVAKLQRHGDVLPPGREPDDGPEADAAAGATAEDTPPLGFTDESTTTVIEAAPVPAPAPDSEPEPATASFEAGIAPGQQDQVEEFSASAAQAEDLGADVAAEPTVTLEAPFDPVAAEHNLFDPVLAELDGGEPVGSDTISIDFDLDAAAAELAGGNDEPAFDTSGGVDVYSQSGAASSADVPEAHFAFDPLLAEEAGTPPPEFPEFDVDDADARPHREDAAPAVGAPAEAPAPDVAGDSAPPTMSGFGPLSLDDGTGPIPESREVHSRFQHDLSDLEQRIAGLELVDDSPARGPEQATGAVLVLAGIGGPDAVRQLLGALPPDFARPVLIQQRLDGARYDKLVAQMQRATPLPVQLAEAGTVAHPGFVYILPADIGVAAGPALRFDQSGELLSRLPSADSAILLLSGSDAAHVDAVMNHSWAGALVAGQAADGCYDAAAPNALAARGGDTAAPAELARRLAERWA